jgi:carbamoyltransferase
MIIIGINAYHADASAAIFVDGKLVAAIEEERFTRVKHWAGFPILSIEFCLREAGIGIDDVDHFAIGRDPKAKFFKKLLFLISNPKLSLSGLKERFQNRKQVSSIENILASHFNRNISDFKSKIQQVEHHRSHLASAFFASPFEESACLSIDGSGDFSTTMTGMGKGNHIEVIDSVDFPHSLGLFYTAFTQFLGFPHYGDEYKVMGMSPYGNPIYTDKVSSLINLSSNGLFSLNLDYFTNPASGIIQYIDNKPVVSKMYNEKFAILFGNARTQTQELAQFHKDLAASVQRVTEQTLFHILNHLHQTTKSKSICIAGGVAQNSVANGKILKETGFEKMYIPSAGHDAGISFGAGLYVQHELLKLKRNTIFSAYTGSRYTNQEITSWLDEKSISYKLLEDADLYETVTECIINGGVIGWMQGRSEFGPRALGGRSILADPRRNDAKEILNLKIKRRESFRPFAPSILKEFADDYFEDATETPFMEKVLSIKPEKRDSIPAVTHVDGSGRLQTVDKEITPRYHQLISAFYKKTGVPILLNTSFNENEPIVNSPEHAYNCFHRTNMDMLVMENIVITRNNN